MACQIFAKSYPWTKLFIKSKFTCFNPNYAHKKRISSGQWSQACVLRAKCQGDFVGQFTRAQPKLKVRCFYN